MKTSTAKTSGLLLRFDDICPDIDGERFLRIMTICEQYSIVPQLGVVPDNKDPVIKKGQFDACWDWLKQAQSRKSAYISMHGFEHECRPIRRSLLNINRIGEFSDASYQEQLEKIKKGKQILASHGITDVPMFMAPCHSFDEKTLQALVQTEFTSITDGFYLFPHKRHGLWWIPQQIWRPRQMPFGLWTICLHLDMMSDEAVNQLEQFLKQHSGEFLNWYDVMSNLNAYDRLSYRCLNIWFNWCFRLLFSLKKIL